MEQRPPRVWASNPEALLDDLNSVISAVAGRSPEREPTRVIGRVDVDAFEAHVGVVKPVQAYDAGADQFAAVRVPGRVRDFAPVLVAPGEVAIVRIVHAADRLLVRALAFGGLVVALGFLLFLFAL
jgi:hypothetical protein